MAFFVSLTNFSICWSIKIRLVFDKSLCPDGSSGSYSTINAMNGVTVCRCAIAIMVILECHSFGDTYNVIDLGALGGYYSRAYDINNVGQIVGLAEVRAGEHRAFLYAKGTMNDLGTLGGKLSVATGINDNGIVTGYSYISQNNTIYHPFIYSNGQMSDIGTLGGQNGIACDINNSLQIVGSTQTSTGADHPFLYSNGTMLDIGSSPSIYGGVALGINNYGQTVGYIKGKDWSDYGFLYYDNVAQRLPCYLANNINDSAQIVGQIWIEGWCGCLVQSDTVILIGGVSAYGINSSGDVVGYGSEGAYIYSDGLFQNLNNLLEENPGWFLAEATDINDLGQIVGVGINPAGLTHAFLLQPIKTSVPDSASSISLLFLGLLITVTSRSYFKI